MNNKYKIKHENNRDKAENIEKTGNNPMWAKSSEAEILGAKRRDKNKKRIENSRKKEKTNNRHEKEFYGYDQKGFLKGYFCSTCKQKKMTYAFFNTDDIHSRKNFLRDKNGKAICYDCKTEKILNSGLKIKPKK